MKKMEKKVLNQKKEKLISDERNFLIIKHFLKNERKIKERKLKEISERKRRKSWRDSEYNQEDIK